MSSKYSEFRKNKHSGQQNSNPPNTQFNIQEIDQMMQALSVNLVLGPKQSSTMARKQSITQLKTKRSQKSQSLKNSQMGQTCDLTTNVDSEPASQLQIEKLPSISRLANRRHHTEQEIGSGSFQIESCALSRTGTELEGECLLDQLEEKEEIANGYIGDEEKRVICGKLRNLERALKDKKISAAMGTTFLEKLCMLQALIQQI